MVAKAFLFFWCADKCISSDNLGNYIQQKLYFITFPSYFGSVHDIGYVQILHVDGIFAYILPQGENVLNALKYANQCECAVYPLPGFQGQNNAYKVKKGNLHFTYFFKEEPKFASQQYEML